MLFCFKKKPLFCLFFDEVLSDIGCLNRKSYRFARLIYEDIDIAQDAAKLFGKFYNFCQYVFESSFFLPYTFGVIGDVPGLGKCVTEGTEIVQSAQRDGTVFERIC